MRECKKWMLFLIGFFCLFHTKTLAADSLVARIQIDHLMIESFSSEWDEEKLYMLYDELISNYTSSEFAYLSRITVYPETNEGVLGYYTEDTYRGNDGQILFGKNAYIELFDANRKNTIEAIAPVLSHEYGHHYTIFHITKHEGLYYNEWATSEYATLRQFSKHPAVYNMADVAYRHSWDVTEIAANDYVQLLGSYHARLPYEYLDIGEMVTRYEGLVHQPRHFNMQPQENMHLPLATDVEGLYHYLLGISGFTREAPSLLSKPKIDKIVKSEKSGLTTYALGFSNARTLDEDLTYTIVMFPENAPSFIEPIKFIDANEARYALLGSIVKTNNKGTYKIENDYFGTYIFLVFAQDSRGYLFASDPYRYEFGTETVLVAEEKPDAFYTSEQTDNMQIKIKEEPANPTETAPTTQSHSILKAEEKPAYVKNTAMTKASLGQKWEDDTIVIGICFEKNAIQELGQWLSLGKAFDNSKTWQIDKSVLLQMERTKKQNNLKVSNSVPKAMILPVGTTFQQQNPIKTVF